MWLAEIMMSVHEDLPSGSQHAEGMASNTKASPQLLHQTSRESVRENGCVKQEASKKQQLQWDFLSVNHVKQLWGYQGVSIKHNK